MNADSTATQAISELSASASDFTNIAKALVSGGVLVWGVKRAIAYFTEQNKNAQQQNHERAGSIDKKEEILITTTADERKQVLEMFKCMIEEQGKQRENARSYIDSITQLADLVKENMALIKGHTEIVTNISKLMQLEKNDILSGLGAALETGFSRYVDQLQTHPELAKTILSQKNNVISYVLEEVAPMINSAAESMGTAEEVPQA